MKRKLKQNIALFSTLALLMTPGVVLAADPTPTPTPPENPAISDKVTLTLDKSKLELTVGEVATLTATITNATDTSVSWSSSDNSIATVDSTGKITAVGAGTVVITAKSNADSNVLANCDVTIKTKQLSSDASIKSLNLTVGTLNKTFSPNDLDYTITIPAGTKELNIKDAITLNDSKAGLLVSGDSNLKNGSKITAVVTAENGQQRTYTFTLVKEAIDLSLKSLRVTGYTLDQAFDPNTLNYTLTIPYEAQDVTIQAAAASSEASVSVSGATGLEVGKSVVTVTVSDNDGNKREYKITVTREAENEEEDEEEENITTTSSSTTPKDDDRFEDNRKDRTLQYVLVSIGCLILFLIGGFGIYFYIKTSKKKKGNGKDKKGNKNQKEQSTPDKEITSASTNDSSTATSNQVDEKQSNIEEENSTASQAETELSEEESKRLSDLEETKEFYLDKEKKKIESAPKAEQEEKRKDDVLKDIEELFDDD